MIDFLIFLFWSIGCFCCGIAYSDICEKRKSKDELSAVIDDLEDLINSMDTSIKRLEKS